MKTKSFKEIQDKFNAIYLSQPKPKQLIVFKGIPALYYSVEVLLHPSMNYQHKI